MSAAAFDPVAPRYDELWTHSAIGRAQRSLVWREIDGLFLPGDRILDVGCGTGEDAAHFTARGVTVDATDASPAMIEVARRRGGFAARVLGAEGVAELPGTYDGAISNFGALNCVEDLAVVARGLASRVRPGGRLAICVIGKFCFWEILYYAARLQFGKAFRRLHPSVTTSLAVTVHYRTVAEIARAFAPGFELQRWAGIGLFVPPSYVPLPEALARPLAALDRVLARVPLARALADHRLLIFVRK